MDAKIRKSIERYYTLKLNGLTRLYERGPVDRELRSLQRIMLLLSLPYPPAMPQSWA